jgi:hypothetical protein
MGNTVTPSVPRGFALLATTVTYLPASCRGAMNFDLAKRCGASTATE